MNFNFPFSHIELIVLEVILDFESHLIGYLGYILIAKHSKESLGILRHLTETSSQHLVSLCKETILNAHIAQRASRCPFAVLASSAVLELIWRVTWAVIAIITELAILTEFAGFWQRSYCITGGLLGGDHRDEDDSHNDKFHLHFFG